jgi:Uma2 family endonuclease
MAETDWHRILMTALLQTLDAWYAKNKKVYVSGNLLIFYEQGNKRKHVSPDVFVVKGVAKNPRPNFLVWEEKKAPDVVIELTSSSTRREDLKKKFDLYQDVLKVQEYFLFDPRGDYLKPPLRGYRLVRGKYEPIEAVQGRLPSRVLDLHLERAGEELRLYDPSASRRLPTVEEENERLRRELQQRRPRSRNKL